MNFDLMDLFDSSLFSVFGIGIHVIIALCFAVHAIRSRQDTYWLYILFIFPLLGSVVYFFAIYLPDARHSRTGRAISKASVNIVDPNRAIRRARNDFDAAPTVQHRQRLAEALLETEDAAHIREALQHFEQCATGPFATEPGILFGLARAQFAHAQLAHAAPDAVRQTLSRLFAHDVASRTQPGPTLLNAQVLSALKDPGARNAFEQAVVHGSDACPRCLYAEWLVAQNDPADTGRARTLFSEIVHDAKHWTRFAREHNQEWIRRAKAHLAKLPQE